MYNCRSPMLLQETPLMLRYTGLGTVMRTHCGLNRAYGAKQSWTTLGDDGIDLGSVSYTHLTLPTKRIV